MPTMSTSTQQPPSPFNPNADVRLSSAPGAPSSAVASLAAAIGVGGEAAAVDYKVSDRTGA